MDERTRPQFFRHALRRRRGVILAAVILGLAAGLFSTFASPQEYRATTVIFLEPLVGNPYSPTTPSGRQEQLAALTTEAGLLLADSVSRAAEAAAEDAGVELGPQLQERTSTEVPSNSQVVQVSFRAGNPQAAQFGAQALATAYLNYRKSRSEDVVDAQLSRIDEEIGSLSSLVSSTSDSLDKASKRDTPESDSEIQNLQEQLRIYANQLAQLRIERASTAGASAPPGQIVSPARVPNSPEGIPAPYVGAAIAVVFFGLGLLLAVVLEHLDSRLRSADDIERLGIGPAYGPIPAWRPTLNSATAEDVYRLATMSTQRGVHAVLGAGAPVPAGAAAGLGHSLSEMGRSVVMVLATADGDSGSQAGLSDALLASSAAGNVNLQEVRPGLRVLGPGRQPDDLPKLVPGSMFVELVRSLADQCDAVIIVGPEAPSATAAAIAHCADSIKMVCVAGRTREADLLAASQLVKSSARHLSTVLLVDAPSRMHSGAPRTTGRRGVMTLLGIDSTTSSPTPKKASAAAHRHHLDAGS